MLIQPADPDAVAFETQMTEDPSAPVTRDGRRLGNRITFGEPVVHDLEALWALMGSGPPFEVRGQLAAYEFWLVRLVCTLHLADNSAVSWFEVRVRFADDGAGARSALASDPADPPVAYDLFPLHVTDEVELEHTNKISPSFKFQNVTASLGEDALTLRYRRLEPRITAFGKLESSIYWRFTPGAQSEVAEGIKEMDVIVRRRRKRRVAATVLVEGRGRKWGLLPAPVEISDCRFSF